MPRERYTAAQYAEAAELRRAGLSLAEVASRTGVARGSCAWHFRRIGLRLAVDQTAALRGKVSDDVRQEVRRRRSAGETAKAIASATGLTPKAVYKLLLDGPEKVRLTPDQRRAIYAQRRTVHDYAPLVEARRAGATVQELADRSGVPWQTLESELPRRGAKVLLRRTWTEFEEGLRRWGLAAVDPPPVGEMDVRPVAVRCFCGRVFEASRPHDALYGRLRSCGCLRSSEQEILADRVAAWGVGVERNSRGVLGNGQEVDLWIPDRKVAIEYNGLHWHADDHKPRGYHLAKLQAAEAVGVRLVQVWESEWLERPDVVLGYLAAILGHVEHAVGARACVVEGASWAEVDAFLDAHHVQGAPPHGRFARVLRHDGRIVATMTCSFGAPRGQAVPRWELTRYCVRAGYRVTGGFARLWAAFLREHRPTQVVSFSDRRWSAGDLYRRAGFREDGIVAPSFWWFRGRGPLVHKAVLSREAVERRAGPLLPGETKPDALRRLGWRRVWDCGLVRWVWPLTSGTDSTYTGNMEELIARIGAALTPDLLREPWRARVLAGAQAMTGHCYVASEALWHLLGGPSSGWAPVFIRHEGAPHWFLRRGEEIADPTAAQFATPVPYALGRGKGFLTTAPSARARVVIQRVRADAPAR